MGPSGKAQALSISLLPDIPEASYSGVFITENAHKCGNPALHPQGKCSIPPANLSKLLVLKAPNLKACVPIIQFLCKLCSPAMGGCAMKGNDKGFIAHDGRTICCRDMRPAGWHKAGKIGLDPDAKNHSAAGIDNDLSVVARNIAVALSRPRNPSTAKGEHP